MTYDSHGLAFTRARDFRLLRLQRIDENGMLHCHLRVANLDERPAYQAISYTWGPSTQTEPSRSGDMHENEQQLHRIVSPRFLRPPMLISQASPGRSSNSSTDLVICIIDLTFVV